jgi:hypothetical protein
LYGLFLARATPSWRSGDDQVEDHLLQLHGVALDRRQPVGELRPHRDTILHCFGRLWSWQAEAQDCSWAELNLVSDFLQEIVVPEIVVRAVRLNPISKISFK